MHYQLEAAGIHQSEFEENIGLGFMRVSRGLESTNSRTSHKSSIAETDGSESIEGDIMPVKKSPKRISMSFADEDPAEEHMLISQSEGTSNGQYTNAHDSLNAAAIIQKFMKDYRTESDPNALFRADSNLSGG